MEKKQKQMRTINPLTITAVISSKIYVI